MNRRWLASRLATALRALVLGPGRARTGAVGGGDSELSGTISRASSGARPVIGSLRKSYTREASGTVSAGGLGIRSIARSLYTRDSGSTGTPITYRSGG